LATLEVSCGVLAVYVSGHGFGHATRTAQILRAVRVLEPNLPIKVASSAPDRIFREAVSEPFEYRRVQCDVGLVQKNALEIDESATVDAWRAFHERSSAWVEAEAEWLRRSGARLVLADIPPPAFEAARAAGVASMGITNFSWDWIYRHLARRMPAFRELSDAAREAYSSAGLLLELPFAGDLSAFPARERIPMVARPQRRPRDETRRALGLADADVAVLLSFGGIGLPGFDPSVLALLGDFVFLVETDRRDVPTNVVALSDRVVAARGLTFLDVVGGADAVVTKPGYGIVTDAIAAGTRLVYTERGDFPEYDVMVAEMKRYLPTAYVSNEDLKAGRLGAPLAEVLAASRPEAPDLSGAERAARRILEHLA
jgi:L-arabinokinase